MNNFREVQQMSSTNNTVRACRVPMGHKFMIYNDDAVYRMIRSDGKLLWFEDVNNPGDLFTINTRQRVVDLRGVS